MKYYKTTARCSECNHKFLYALTEEEVEESDILEAVCPECGEMTELENLVACTESMYDSIIEVYEAFLEEDLEFDIEDFEDELEDDDW